MTARLQRAYENLEEHAGFSVVISIKEIEEKERLKEEKEREYYEGLFA